VPPGVLGFPGVVKHTNQKNFSIKRLLADAVDKDTVTPLLVFIEVNSELTPDKNIEASFFEELAESWKAVQIKEWPRGFPAIGVIFYNDTAPWHLATELPEHNSIWAFGIAAEQHRHQFDAWPLITTILGATMQRSNWTLNKMTIDLFVFKNIFEINGLQQANFQVVTKSRKIYLYKSICYEKSGN
jgi:hypothetical protein